jgi:hypothetical protein
MPGDTTSGISLFTLAALGWLIIRLKNNPLLSGAEYKLDAVEFSPVGWFNAKVAAGSPARTGTAAEISSEVVTQKPMPVTDR